MTDLYFVAAAFFSTVGTIAFAGMFLLLGMVGQKNSRLKGWHCLLFYAGTVLLFFTALVRLYTRMVFVGDPLAEAESEYRSTWVAIVLLLQGIAFGLALIGLFSYKGKVRIREADTLFG